ncbi:ATP-binding protein [Marinactinospora rubrisoli]|uniref:ATP-binding protein n=1 Tax=Marinactinospora rubrisoli TaxID=2715399 RepID=A0ABW2KGE1_9ACTN
MTMHRLHVSHFPGTPKSVAAARAWLTWSLASPFGPVVPDDVQANTVLLTSELATNALRHTTSGDSGTFSVGLALWPHALRVYVTDEGIGDTSPTLKSPGLMAESGRGLLLVDALANAWGRMPGEPVVWFRLEWPPRQAPPLPRRDRGRLYFLPPHPARTPPDTDPSPA